MEKIKLLALDLDGTTLTSRNTLSAEVRAAIERAVNSGIEVVVASGRPYGSMHESVLSIEGVDYVISSNGAAIYKNGVRIKSTLLSELDVLFLLDATAEYDVIFEAFVNGLTYADRRYTDNPLDFGDNEAYVDYVKAAHGKLDDMRKFILENRRRLDSIEIISPDSGFREMLRKKIGERSENMYITSSSANFIEFMDKTATKSNAVKWICDSMGIDIRLTAACGNADNDVDMIDQAGLGAAVSNAAESCLSAASLVVASNDDNGVAELIDKILRR